MSLSPRTTKEALAFLRGQVHHRSQDWEGMCQMLARTSYGIGSGFGSAWLQWLGADHEDKHAGGDPAKAPVGSALLYKGSGPFGHIMIAANPFPNGVAAAFSNDLVRAGDVNKVARTAPVTQWNQGYLGYLTAINDVDLRLGTVLKPKPKQNKKYLAISRAIDKMELALEKAKAQKDAADVKLITEEIHRLKAMYAKLRHF